jgi:predicted Zn-dependent peptidase
MDKSIALMNEVMSDAVVNQEAYDNLVQDILKERANAKLNKRTILHSGLVNYAKYGSKSPFTDLLSEDELRAINPQELIDIIKGVSSYQHGYFYYGPDSDKKIAGLLKKMTTPSVLQAVPKEMEYPELPMDKPVIYFTDYDMVQTEIILIAKDNIFNPALMPVQEMFNSYYGAGMGSIVFQEIREARGLAYGAYAWVSNPYKKGLSDYIRAYVGTQSDKMPTAIDVFKELLTNMPQSEKAFSISKDYVLNNIRTARLTKSSIFWNYMWQKDLGLSTEWENNKIIFEQVQKMELADIQQFFDTHIKPAQYSILIVGKRDKVDFNYLNKIAEVKELGLDVVFGY